jgi:hypothetical protein
VAIVLSDAGSLEEFAGFVLWLAKFLTWLFLEDGRGLFFLELGS